MSARRSNPPPRSIPACAGEPDSVRRTLRRPTVYPRVCGGTSTSVSLRSSPIGLSPRVRGNRVVRQDCCLPYRSIPACAGEPRSAASCRCTEKVYPRVCGGTEGAGDGLPGVSGLSPRVRGNRTYPTAADCFIRSIPACAGEPQTGIAAAFDSGVYPRVCGGTLCGPACRRCRRGLSPRVRGNQEFDGGLGFDGGSIPACAGEPQAVQTPAIREKVYPRVCGGTRSGNPGSLFLLGLSPRVRGNRNTHIVSVYCIGSIPACAGEPTSRRPCRQSRQVYPRVCGGTWRNRLVPPLCSGLSPRVRGNLTSARASELWGRSIPACAGEPEYGYASTQRKAVYPRVCGGTASRTPTRRSCNGLSPRVRGNPDQR